MSFILDALRKSEHQRQKSTGPGLAEIPVAAPRPKTNVWATAAVTLLVVNLTAVGVLLLRRADPPETPAAASTPGQAPAASAPTPAAAATPPVANPTLAPPAPTTATAAPAAQRPAEPGRNPLAEEVGDIAPGLEPGMADAAASIPAGPPAVARQGAPNRGGSVVYAPVPEANDAPYTPPPAEPEASAEPAPSRAALPGADDMVARGMPELHLDLHVYSNVPKQRFIFVNSRKYVEGDTLQEGAVVEKITPDGAVLSFRGSRFKLSH